MQAQMGTNTRRFGFEFGFEFDSNLFPVNSISSKGVFWSRVTRLFEPFEVVQYTYATFNSPRHLEPLH